jgi:hypothetical protein
LEHWFNRGLVAFLLFAGILAARGGFLTAAAIAAVSIPLAALPGTWNALMSLAVVVFLAGLFMLLTGLRLPIVSGG